MSTTFLESIYKKYTDVMPKGAGALFSIQMFSTLSFSVLYSTLVLYATNGLKLSDAVSTGITASFIAFNYALHLLGGYIGGRYLSYRVLFCIGMISQIVGCIFLSFNTLTFFYWGLATFLAGCGLNVTCINCMLTQLFKPQDKRREAAFLWNYSGMNVGFFVGFAVSGYFQLLGNYSTLFLLASLGNVIAVLITFFKWRLLNDINTRVAHLPKQKRKMATINGFMMIFILVFALRFLLEHAEVSNNLVMFVGVLMGFVMLTLAFQQPNKEKRNKILAYIVLALTSLVFWTLYQLAPMGLTLFIERNVDRHYLGWMIAPQWVQNINTIVIIIGGPVLSMIFSALRERGINMTIPLQFSVALILIGVAFAILPIGIYFSDLHGLSHFNWILACFILQSIGELFISPIGYAMVGQFAPEHLQGLMMGTWLMITGVAATLSGYFSSIALGNSSSIDPIVTNSSFSYTFGLLGWIAIITGLLLIFLIPFILHLTQEKKLFVKAESTA